MRLTTMECGFVLGCTLLSFTQGGAPEANRGHCWPDTQQWDRYRSVAHRRYFQEHLKPYTWLGRVRAGQERSVESHALIAHTTRPRRHLARWRTGCGG